MGSRNLKKINFGPTTKLNTLNSSAGPSTWQSSDGRPTKRQRRDSTQSQSLMTSRYFNSARRTRHDDLIQDGFQEDSYDIKSISSAGNTTNAPTSTVPEFRNAQVKGNSSSGRVRRSRQPRGPVVAKSSSPSEPRDLPDSPDILTMDNEPAPANVMSDLPEKGRNTKRFRVADRAEPPLKRTKPVGATDEDIEDSADELAVEPTSAKGTKRLRKITNLVELENRHSDQKAASKGDIPRTAFQSSKKSQPSNAFILREAVAGKYLWEAQPNQRAALVPHERHGVQLIVNEERSGQGVFDIDWGTVRDVWHAATHSRFVRIRRTVTGDIPSTLILEFESVKDATNFFATIPTRKDIFQERSSEAMEIFFLQAKKKASEYQDKNGPVKDTLHIQSKALDTRSLPSHVTRNSNIESAAGGSEGSKREKLTDKMARSAEVSGSGLQCQDLTEANEEIQTAGRSLRSNAATTRSARHAPPQAEQHFVDRWSLKNPAWRDNWQKSLVYPATGKNRATVDADDIVRLDEGEFLNDNLISFYLRYLQAKLEQERPEILDKVHIFSSFFYEKLKSRTKYDGVKGWTARIDLFSYDYIVVPVNEHLHWYLAIICNPGKTLPSAQSLVQEVDEDRDQTCTGEVTSSPKTRNMARHAQAITVDDDTSSPATVRISDDLHMSSPRQPGTGPSKLRRSTSSVAPQVNLTDPKIVTLDSLGSPHSPTCKTLKDYLENEAQDKKGVKLALNPSGMKAKGIPQQNNFCDCGVFILGYMEEFLKAPDEVARRLLQKEELDWNINPQRLRNDIRTLLFDLQSEQQERLATERANKKASRLKRKSANESDASDTAFKANSGLASSPGSPLPGTAMSAPASPKAAKASAYNNATTPQQPTPDLSKDQEFASTSVSKSPPMGSSTARESPSKSEQTRPRSSPRTAQTSPKPQRFIEKLKDDSSELSGDAFYSAPSSPGSKLVTREGLPSLAAEVQPSEHFVQQIPSSDSENESKMRRVSKTLQSKVLRSIEVSEDEKDVVNIDDHNHNQFGAILDAAPSFERVSSNKKESSGFRQPRYEGIERSIEN